MDDEICGWSWGWSSTVAVGGAEWHHWKEVEVGIPSMEVDRAGENAEREC